VRRRRFSVALPLAAALVALAAGQAPPDRSRNLGCVPTPEVKAALAKVPRRDAACDPADPCWVAKIRAAEALVERHPFDVHVHRRYQDLVTARNHDMTDPVTRAAADRYTRFVEAHPDDPLAHYLAARFNDNRAEAEQALALKPTFAWPHGLLATLDAGGAAGSAGAELEAFARLCPDRFDEVLRRDRTSASPEIWQRLLPPARAALRKGPPAEQIPWYASLWDREFTAWPPDQHAAVRRRVRDDLARIESWKRRGDESWWQALQTGYKMLDDPEGLERVDAAYAKRFPCSWTGVERTIDAFIASRGGHEGLHDQTPSQWRDAYEKTGRWLDACPDQYKYLSYHFEAAENLPEVIDNQALAAEADRYLAGWERIAADWNVFPSPYAEVAAAFLGRGLDPARALDFARKARAAYLEDRKPLATMTLTEAQRRQYDDWNRIVDFGVASLIAEAALASGERAPCDAALAEAEALYRGFSAEQRAAIANAPGSHSRYWRVRARVAEADRRPADAIACWRLAVEHADTRTTGRTTAADRAALERLWTTLGGTAEGLALLAIPPAAAAGAAPAAEPAASLPWESPGDALPPFTLTDLDGRSWKLAELTGKTVFINVWATWCGPCKAEIPHLRELNDRLRGRADVVLLSFNTDDSAGVVAPFARANRMTWPVLLAAAYFESLGGEMSVPQNWVLDGAGVRRKVQRGFDPAHSEVWVRNALAAIDQAARP